MAVVKSKVVDLLKIQLYLCFQQDIFKIRHVRVKKRVRKSCTNVCFFNNSRTNRDRNKTKYVLESSFHFLGPRNSDDGLKKVVFILKKGPKVKKSWKMQKIVDAPPEMLFAIKVVKNKVVELWKIQLYSNFQEDIFKNKHVRVKKRVRKTNYPSLTRTRIIKVIVSQQFFIIMILFFLQTQLSPNKKILWGFWMCQKMSSYPKP